MRVDAGRMAKGVRLKTAVPIEKEGAMTLERRVNEDAAMRGLQCHEALRCLT